MNEAVVAEVLQSRGCVMQAFEHHAHFFGNWRARFSHGQRGFEVVSDHRDGWMDMWEYPPDCTGRQLHEQRSHTFDQADELAVLASWLDETLVR
ncbi:hypothetical protein ACG04R_03075 [Roseateles sp. BYS78W]|uniref:Uncharacterized protein n=1 Tax=Pelomonas candidula TaxID=3299025 RepID=A0ABW7H727_9BURK